MPCHTPEPDDDYKDNSIKNDLYIKLCCFLNIPQEIELKNLTEIICSACRNIDAKDLKKIVSKYFKTYSSEKMSLYDFYKHHLLDDLKWNATIGHFEHVQLTLNELKGIENKGD